MLNKIESSFDGLKEKIEVERTENIRVKFLLQHGLRYMQISEILSQGGSICHKDEKGEQSMIKFNFINDGHFYNEEFYCFEILEVLRQWHYEKSRELFE